MRKNNKNKKTPLDIFLEGVENYEEMKNDILDDLIVVDNSVFEGKDDPTQYCNDRNIIYVKSNYDVELDKEGWIVHELEHHKHRNKRDDNRIYPHNKVEKYAYEAQFSELKRRGYSFKDIQDKSKFPTLSLKFIKYDGEYFNILKRYWDNAK